MTSTRTPRTAEEGLAFLQSPLAAWSVEAAASRLGLLARLELAPASPPELARDCNIDEKVAETFLRALALVGVAERTANGKYEAILANLWRLTTLHDLSEALRNASGVSDGPSGGHSGALAVRGGLLETAAEQVAAHLAPLAGRVLDLGLGPAVWSIAMARADPNVRITLIASADVQRTRRRAVAAAHVEASFAYLPGDALCTDLGKGYDLALAANLCHLLDEEEDLRLMRRLIGAIKPGGRVVLIDALPNERLDGPRDVLLYGLELLLRTPTSQLYPFSSFVGWLRSAGFERIQRYNLSPSLPLTVITARRPASEAEPTKMRIQETAGVLRR